MTFSNKIFKSLRISQFYLIFKIMLQNTVQNETSVQSEIKKLKNGFMLVFIYVSIRSTYRALAFLFLL